MPSAGSRLHLIFYRLQFAAKSLRGPELLGFALGAACVYAAFAGGAIRSPQEPRLQVGLAVIATVTAIAWTVVLSPAHGAERAARRPG